MACSTPLISALLALLVAPCHGARVQMTSPFQQTAEGNYEAQCESENDYGWPRFQSLDELLESPWALYFAETYIELPSEYPLCIYDMWAINKEAYIKANLTGHPVVPPSSLKEGDLFEGGLLGYQIYHGSWKPLPANTWFEFSHVALPTELQGFWAWRQRGSGVWYNTGKTIVFPTPADNSQIHKEAIAFLSENCSKTPSKSWPQQESDIFGFCAREKGYDTIQFEPHAGEVPLGTFGQPGLTEVAMVNIDGKYSCGVEDSSKTQLRQGWRASQQCLCENVRISDSCGLMPRPPFPLSILGASPPICALQGKYIWKDCDPLACRATSCGPKELEPVTPLPLVIDFGDYKYKKVEGQWHQCCCRSDVLSNPFESKQVVCELIPVYRGASCGKLKGQGWHSWNNMGWKYRDLDHFGQCDIPPKVRTAAIAS